MWQGRPAEAVYFSTSNGRTYGNEDVFGSAPLPYLRPVIETDDAASPTSRWRTRIQFADLATILARAGHWPAETPITRVRSGSEAIVVSGDDVTRTVSLEELRDAVNTWAACLKPGRYPQDGLPVTIPSRWFGASVARRHLVMTGRGWGHGVGMVQWGAYGKARRGWPADRILAFYFGGLRPQRFPEPGLITIEVATGLSSLRVVPSAAGARMLGEPVHGPIVLTGGDELFVTTSPS